ncbi:MAG: hypothetical protein U0Z53_15090 [Blastocatellia bacterium]
MRDHPALMLNQHFPATERRPVYREPFALPSIARQCAVRALSNHDYERVMTLLGHNPIYSIHLRGMIEDYGLTHPAHRGRFFGYYEDDWLAGVALLGHALLVFTEPDSEEDAFRHFAQMAADTWTEGHFIYGPRLQVEAFWQHLFPWGYETRLVNNHHFYVCHHSPLRPARLQLQPATLCELEAVLRVQAEMVIEECGIDPREKDPQGFRRRVSERILRQRTWVRMENGEVIFKAELASETPEVIYLEGIWTHPSQCLSELPRHCLTELIWRLFKQRAGLSLLAEASIESEICLLTEAGFIYREDYQARFLKSAAGSVPTGRNQNSAAQSVIATPELCIN